MRSCTQLPSITDSFFFFFFFFFRRDMCVGEDGAVPAFRQRYVEEVIRRIERNAALEFACLWRERETTGLPLTVLSNRLSVAINSLTDELASSPLWSDLPLRRRILAEAIPALLQEAVGLDTLLSRVPEPYLKVWPCAGDAIWSCPFFCDSLSLSLVKAMFSSHIASNFVYECGFSSSSQMAFFSYMQTKM